MSGPAISTAPNWQKRASLGFVLASLLFGGAGTGYPLLAFVLLIFAIATILLHARSVFDAGQSWQMRVALAAWGLMFVTVALALVPVPWSWWTLSPGREVAVRIYRLLGWEGRWHALSLTPDGTRTMLLDLLPPLAGLLAIARAPLVYRRRLLRAVVLVACGSTALSALQIAGGPELAPVLYETAHRGFGVGLFVNRNHQAAFLLVALILTLIPGVIAPDRAGRPGLRRAGWSVVVAIWAFLALGLLATGSRTGMVLLPVAGLAGVLIAVPAGADRRRWLAGGAIAGFGGFALSWTPLVQSLLGRFSTVAEDQRYDYWDNTLFALHEFWPLGSGPGSFTTIYPTVEPLDQVSSLTVNHAHSDVLELLLEGGLAFAGVMGIVVAAIAWLVAARVARDREADTPGTALAAASALALLLACSLVDYPLRMTALAVVAAMLVGLLVPEPSRKVAESAPAAGKAIVVAGLALVLAWQAGAAVLGATLLSAKRPETAVAVAPWSARAWVTLADQRFVQGDAVGAADAAIHALAIRPIEPAAVRTLGLARIALNQEMVGQALLETGARLGWRDGPNQLWLIRRAAEAGAADVAVQRIDALLRQDTLAPKLFPVLRALALDPGTQPEVVAQLAQYPSWRQGLFNDLSEVTPAYPAQVVALLEALHQAGAGATPAETALMRWQLQKAGDATALRHVWKGSDGRHLLGDGTFDTPSGLIAEQAPPYAWQTMGLPGANVVIAMPDAPLAGQAAMVTTDGTTFGPVFKQTVALVPGNYRLSAAVLLAQGADLNTTGWSVQCGARLIPVALQWSPSTGLWKSVRGTFTVGADCPVQALVFGLLKSDGGPISVVVDQVVIDSAPPGKAGR